MNHNKTNKLFINLRHLQIFIYGLYINYETRCTHKAKKRWQSWILQRTNQDLSFEKLEKNVVKGNLFCLWNAVTANRQKVAKEFLRRVLFVNSYEPVETFTMQAAYFLYCTVNYFLQRMSHLFLIGLMSTKEVILWNALLLLYYVTKGLDLMAIINLWKNFMYLNY